MTVSGGKVMLSEPKTHRAAQEAECCEAKILSQQLGHSAVSFMMDKYCHPLVDEHRRVALSVNELLGSTGWRPQA